MPRLINPVDWRLVAVREDDSANPLFSLVNSKGHQFHLHIVDQGLIRIVHSLPYQSHLPRLRNHKRTDDVGLDGFAWEKRRQKGNWQVKVDDQNKQAIITGNNTIVLCIKVDYSSTVTLTWYCNNDPDSFLTDFKAAYLYDAQTQRVFHQVCRQQSYVPLSEHDRSANENNLVPDEKRFEFIYGLGESKGSILKDGKRYFIDARDSLAADPQDTDPLYKLCPFYLHFNKLTQFWYGLYYNTFSPSTFDFSGEHDFATGQFRSFSTNSGPLDYYLLVGNDGKNSLPSIVTQFARLVTPFSSGPCGFKSGADDDGWQSSPTLPHLSQFGYLASSLTLSERHDAQEAVIGYVEEAHSHGFPIDSMHLSSGYAVDSTTGERNYFTWNSIKYPDPAALGFTLEKNLCCKVIINVKPWLLETHSSYGTTAERGAFVRAAPDSRSITKGERPADPDRCGHFSSQPARTMHWSKGMGETGKGSYFDYSSKDGCQEWQRLMTQGVLNKNISGFWIDNNEFSSLIDDEEELKGEIDLWSIPEVVYPNCKRGDEVAKRMGWGKSSISVGSVGRAVLTMGMARATFQHLYTSLVNKRPIIVTRSAIPGMQAFCHATWSGDNSTTWMSLKWSTKLSLSFGLCFGMGLYGHDIGGFAGQHSPSPELLIRWCQQSLWFTRFTIHSWKKISTTPWMYGKEETDMIRSIIQQRYQLIPMLYSMYITHYHRRGWPVIKPLLWYHSKDYRCLSQDEQFLVGSHILIAPICDFGHRNVTFQLPGLIDDVVDDRATSCCCWYDLYGGPKWYEPGKEGMSIILGEYRLGYNLN